MYTHDNAAFAQLQVCFVYLALNMPFWERGSVVTSLMHCGAPKAGTGAALISDQCMMHVVFPTCTCMFVYAWAGPCSMCAGLRKRKVRIEHHIHSCCQTGIADDLEHWLAMGCQRIPVH